MNPVILLGITVIVFVGVLGVGALVYYGWRSRQQARATSLAQRLGMTDEPPKDDPLLTFQQGDGLGDMLGGLGNYMQDQIRQADVDYDVAGLMQRMAGSALVGVIVLLLILRSPWALAGLLAGLIPLWLLARRSKKRAMALSAQLPDALDLVARSLQAGHGLSDAMRLCAEEMQMPVAREFGLVYEEHNLGRDMRNCLDNLANRNPRNFDLKIFVSSVMLQRDTGGNLIEILENISKTIRDRFVFQAKVRALTAETRMSAIILGGLPFILGVLITVVRPDYLTPLVDDPLGNIAAGAGGTWFLIGLVIMRGLTKVEV